MMKASEKLRQVIGNLFDAFQWLSVITLIQIAADKTHSSILYLISIVLSIALSLWITTFYQDISLNFVVQHDIKYNKLKEFSYAASAGIMSLFFRYLINKVAADIVLGSR